MPKEFSIPPVVFPTSTLQHRRPPTAPFQPSSNIPFISFAATNTPSSSFPPPPHLHQYSPLFEPSLLEELEINPTLIWHKTLAILNPFKINPFLHLNTPDLSGPFLFYFSFALLQLLSRKNHFGVLLGSIALSSLLLYSLLNFLSGNNGTLHLYRCFCVVGYSLMPIVAFSAVSLFLPPKGGLRFGVGAIFVAWAARVCSTLLADNAVDLLDHRCLIAYPCFLVYSLFSLFVLF